MFKKKWKTLKPEDIIKELNVMGYTVYLKHMDEFSYTDFNKKEVCVCETLDLEPKIYHLYLQYNIVKNLKRKTGKTHLEIVFIEEDKQALKMCLKTKNFKEERLKLYSFIYNKISHLNYKEMRDEIKQETN